MSLTAHGPGWGGGGAPGGGVPGGCPGGVSGGGLILCFVGAPGSLLEVIGGEIANFAQTL